MKNYVKLLKDYEKLKLEYEELKKENKTLRQQFTTLQRYKVPSSTNTDFNDKKQFVKEQNPTSQLNTHRKIQLFKSLFRGREDVYALRWEDVKNSKSGYSPSCANQWKSGICHKPKVKCNQCSNRAYLSLTDRVIYEHLSKETNKTIGIYPLLQDETCYFLAVDFDKTNWKEDVLAFVTTCKELGVPVALEKSRSGNGAHVWIFLKNLLRQGKQGD